MKKESSVVIKLEHVNKSFHVGEQDIPVLKDISVSIDKGAFAVLFGPSGCGKSTTLHVILGLEHPNSGDVSILGNQLYKGTTEDDRAEFRKNNIGTVYQQSNWIKSFTVLENVMFPLLLLGYPKDKAMNKALDSLVQVGMQDWKDYIPSELSGGQQQRIDIARALVNDPTIIVADEPTGNLDFESGQKIMQLLKGLSTDMGKTILMVTHDLEYLVNATKVIKMFDGAIVEVKNSGEDESKILTGVGYKRGVKK